MTSLRVPPSRVIARRAQARRGNLGEAVALSLGLSCVPACTARLPRLLRSLAMTNLIACFTRMGAMTKLRVFCSL